MRIQFLPDGSLFVLIIITNKVVIKKKVCYRCSQEPTGLPLPVGIFKPVMFI